MGDVLTLIDKAQEARLMRIRPRELESEDQEGDIWLMMIYLEVTESGEEYGRHCRYAYTMLPGVGSQLKNVEVDDRSVAAGLKPLFFP